jgi:hypothetical protein
LLVRDRGTGEIERSMQLIANCTAQAYNRRKDRHGAFWEDCYHATAVVSVRPIEGENVKTPIVIWTENANSAELRDGLAPPT